VRVARFSLAIQLHLSERGNMSRQYHYYMERNRDREEQAVDKECDDIEYDLSTEVLIENYRKGTRQ